MDSGHGVFFFLVLLALIVILLTVKASSIFTGFMNIQFITRHSDDQYLYTYIYINSDCRLPYIAFNLYTTVHEGLSLQNLLLSELHTK
jgi:hypothetical protein